MHEESSSALSPLKVSRPLPSHEAGCQTAGALGQAGGCLQGLLGSHLCLQQRDRWLLASDGEDGEDDQPAPPTAFILSPLTLTRCWPAPRLRPLRSAELHVL